MYLVSRENTHFYTRCCALNIGDIWRPSSSSSRYRYVAAVCNRVTTSVVHAAPSLFPRTLLLMTADGLDMTDWKKDRPSYPLFTNYKTPSLLLLPTSLANCRLPRHFPPCVNRNVDTHVYFLKGGGKSRVAIWPVIRWPLSSNRFDQTIMHALHQRMTTLYNYTTPFCPCTYVRVYATHGIVFTKSLIHQPSVTNCNMLVCTTNVVALVFVLLRVLTTRQLTKQRRRKPRFCE